MKKQLLFICIFIGMLFIAACGGKDDMSTNTDCPDCPVITAITPASGLPGTEITITGKNFTGLESVLFDGANAVAITLSKTTATQTMVIVPDIPNKNGPVKVTVTRKFTSGSGALSTLTSTENITFTYTKAPEIANIAPLSAKVGEILTITGKYLGTSPMVTFPNGTKVSATVISDSEIRVAVPSKAGNGKIQVATSGQTVTSLQDFTYVISYTVSTPYTLDGIPGDLNFSNGRFIVQFGGGTWSGLLFIPVTGPFAQLNLSGSPGGGFRPDGKFIFIDPNGSGNLHSVSPGNNSVFDSFGPSGVSGTSADIACITNEQMAIISYDNFVTSLNLVQISGASQPPVVTSINMYLPQRVCVFNGKIYATGPYVVSEIISNAASNIAGSNTLFGYTDGSLTAARFYNLVGIAMNEPTKIYVVDNGNHCVRLIDLATNQVSTIAGTGNAGFADGPGSAAQFRYPSGICFDNEGNLFISDATNAAIRKITIQ